MKIRKLTVPILTWNTNIVDKQQWLDRENGINNEQYHKVKSIVLFNFFKFPVYERNFNVTHVFKDKGKTTIRGLGK